jgi:DNA (cytosine-5)-methyltransferase 1
MENEIRYFSMFTGVGGFELGLERANDRLCSKINQERFQSNKQEGNSSECSSEKRYPQGFRAVGFSEIDKYSNELLKNKWLNIKNWGDCTKINPHELPDFDMLCGGFPCQAFSIAGKRRGFSDTRGTLFFDIARIVKIKRPKIVFLENVKGLLNHEQGKTFRKIIQTLSELGYNVQWMVLNSKFFGVPQNRERVFIIGNLRGESRPEILPFNGNVGEINIKVAGYLNKDGWDKRNECIRRIYDSNGCSPTIPTGQGGGVMPKVLDDYNHRIKSDGIVGTVRQTFNNSKEGNGCKIIEDINIRRLTPLECERLQGFPDNWTAGFSDTQRYKMMGNAVTVNVIKAIGERLCSPTKTTTAREHITKSEGKK